MVARQGIMRPPGFSSRSLAPSTDGSIDSPSRNEPIHSEMMTSKEPSTFFTSSSTTSTTSPTPFAAATSRAFAAMPERSTATTRVAPAFAHSTLSTPEPAPTSRTTPPLILGSLAMATRYASMRASSSSMPSCIAKFA